MACPTDAVGRRAFVTRKDLDLVAIRIEQEGPKPTGGEPRCRAGNSTLLCPRVHPLNVPFRGDLEADMIQPARRGARRQSFDKYDPERFRVCGIRRSPGTLARDRRIAGVRSQHQDVTVELGARGKIANTKLDTTDSP